MIRQGELSSFLRSDTENPPPVETLLTIHSAADVLYPRKRFAHSDDGGEILIFTRERPFERFLESERKTDKFGFAVLYYYDQDLLATVVGESTHPIDPPSLEDMTNLFINNVIHEQDNPFFPRDLNPRSIFNYIMPRICFSAGIIAMGHIAYVTGNAFGGELITTPIFGAAALAAMMINRDIFLAALLGKRTDEMREEGFPEIAYQCSYGKQARDILLAEKAELERNLRMAHFSERLHRIDMPMPKEAVGELYKAFTGKDTIKHIIKATEIHPQIREIGLDIIAKEYLRSLKF